MKELKGQLDGNTYRSAADRMNQINNERFQIEQRVQFTLNIEPLLL